MEVSDALRYVENGASGIVASTLAAEVNRLTLKTKAMRLVLSPLSVRAGISQEDLISLLTGAEENLLAAKP